MNKIPIESEIIRSWEKNKENILVSIICIAYNHSPYIKDSIEGFLKQKTNFPFEIIIHDDASTDGTNNIIKEYEAMYPNIIKAICQSENQYSKGKRDFFMQLFPMCKGKYIAMCEGDDYWVDENKLSIQALFLEKNEEFVISGHDAIIVDENGKDLKRSVLGKKDRKDRSKEDLILGKAWITTMSRLIRKVELENVPEKRMVQNGDLFLVSLLGKYGKSHYHFDIKPAVYRLHSNSIWSSKSNYIKDHDTTNTWFWMYRYYDRIKKDKYKNHYLKKYILSVLKKAKLSYLFKEIFIRFIFYRKVRMIAKTSLKKMGLLDIVRKFV